MTSQDPFESLVADLHDEWVRAERTRRGRQTVWLVVTALGILAIPVAVAFDAPVVGVVLFAISLFSLTRFLSNQPGIRRSRHGR
jgi:hypothetical protein